MYGNGGFLLNHGPDEAFGGAPRAVHGKYHSIKNEGCELTREQGTCTARTNGREASLGCVNDRGGEALMASEFAPILKGN